MTEVASANSKFPTDWSVRRIDEVARITTGSRNTQDRVEDGLFPFFVRSQDVERINTWSFDGEAVLTAGDGVGTGKVFHYINGKFDCHQRVYRVAEFDEAMNGFFFFKQFSQNFYDRIMSMTAKSSVDSVRREMIAGMEIPVPPIDEQKRIAQALRDIDKLIASLDALIAKKRDIKQGAMQQLLTGKRRLPGFLEEWEEVTLGSLGIFLKGTGVRRDQAQSGSIPCVRYGELYTRHHNIIRSFGSHVSRGVAASASALRSGDILFAGSGETKEEIGKCAAFVGAHEAVAGSDIIIFRPKGQCSTYLGYVLNLPAVAQQKAGFAQGDAVVHIASTSLARIALRIPKSDEQKAIADIMEIMASELESLLNKQAKMVRIRQGMAQQLLTGRIRLA